MRTSLLLSAASLAFALPAAAHAASPDTPPGATAPAADTGPDGQSSTASKGDEIVVTGVLQQSERDVLAGTSVMKGEELTRDIRPSIGETLAKQPGVSATSFGPSASRPILRGFQGERVSVLTDGIGSINVSNTSADHATIIDPLLADRVEVLRGPAVLLYSSSTIGGVVNVIDKRIPRSVPAGGYDVNAIASYGSAANERSIAGAGDAALGRQFVLHADASYVKSDDLDIGGYALTPAARARALAAAAGPTLPEDPDFAATAAIRGTLPNTQAETWTAGLGLAYIGDHANLGVSYAHYDSLYGVPIRYALASGEEQEAPRLDVLQNRFDVRGEADLGGFFSKVRVRGGYANYRHFELDEDGSVGTAFYNKGMEGRLELVQANRGGWTGASGVQYFKRKFDVVGDEAFLPRSTSDQLGLFTLQQFEFGKIHAEAGLRYERSNAEANPDAGDLRFFAGKRSYDAISGSAGISYALSDDVRLGVNLSRTERAPSADELFANGGHGGTQTWEIGNPDFGLEKSWGLETTLHAHKDGFSFDASAYYDWFTGYISENQVGQSICQAAATPSGRTVDLPCFQFQQSDARYYGVEGDVSARLATIGATTLNVDLLGDYVHASAANGTPVPRIPPARLLGPGLEAQSDLLTARVEVEHAFDQDRIAPFETTTSGYTLVNASLGIKPFATNPAISLTLSANNIFDVDARRHSSFLKDFAPLAGRDLRATLRLGF